MDPATLYARFKNSPHGRWIVGLNDFEKLANVIKEFKPKRILELGTGIGASTALIASVTDAPIDTVEQFDTVMEIAQDLIPRDLQKNITFHHSESEVVRLDGMEYIYFQHYRELPKGEFDFVFIDGPGPYLDTKRRLVDLPGGDFMTLLSQNNVGTHYYIDGRLQMANIMQRYFGNYLVAVASDGQYSLFEQIQKAEGSFSLRDRKLSTYMAQGYFS